MSATASPARNPDSKAPIVPKDPSGSRFKAESPMAVQILPVVLGSIARLIVLALVVIAFDSNASRSKSFVFSKRPFQSELRATPILRAVAESVTKHATAPLPSFGQAYHQPSAEGSTKSKREGSSSDNCPQ